MSSFSLLFHIKSIRNPFGATCKICPLSSHFLPPRCSALVQAHSPGSCVFALVTSAPLSRGRQTFSVKTPLVNISDLTGHRVEAATLHVCCGECRSSHTQYRGNGVAQFCCRLPRPALQARLFPTLMTVILSNPKSPLVTHVLKTSQSLSISLRAKDRSLPVSPGGPGSNPATFYFSSSLSVCLSLSLPFHTSHTSSSQFPECTRLAAASEHLHCLLLLPEWLSLHLSTCLPQLF